MLCSKTIPLDILFSLKKTTHWTIQNQLVSFWYNTILTFFLFFYTLILTGECRIDWEYLMKGFLIKDWGIIQGQYYINKKWNERKYNSTRWAVRVLTLLHDLRQSIWHLQNAAIHGGPTALTSKVLWQQLLREIRRLYVNDWSDLLYLDKDNFKLTLPYRLKQVNQHLLFWTKPASLTFDQCKEIWIHTCQQQYITDWLQVWEDPCLPSVLTEALDLPKNMKYTEDSFSSETVKNQVNNKEQMEMTEWLKSWGDRPDTETFNNTALSPTVDLWCLMVQINIEPLIECCIELCLKYKFHWTLGRWMWL